MILIFLGVYYRSITMDKCWIWNIKQQVPSFGNGFDPFGFGTKGDTWFFEQECLFLYAHETVMMRIADFCLSYFDFTQYKPFYIYFLSLSFCHLSIPFHFLLLSLVLHFCLMSYKETPSLSEIVLIIWAFLSKFSTKKIFFDILNKWIKLSFPALLL